MRSGGLAELSSGWQTGWESSRGVLPAGGNIRPLSDNSNCSNSLKGSSAQSRGFLWSKLRDFPPPARFRLPPPLAFRAGFLFLASCVIDMAREKRSAQVKAHITPAMREQLELFVEQEGNVVSISDYLFNVLEEHIELRTVRVFKKTLGRRVGNQ